MFTSRAWLGRQPVLVFAAVVAFHAASAWRGGPALNWHGQTSEYYQLLTDAFLSGQTSLLIRPSAEMLALPDPYDPVANANLRLHDASLYRGKYYLYFGPVPALVLFMPYRVLTGSHLPSRCAVALFCSAGFAFSCLLFFLLARREKWDCPSWFASAVVLSLGTAPAISFLVARPSFYEVAISAGYCFVMAGFLFTARALEPNSRPIPFYLAAGLCFGLAVGCRPNFALVAVLMVSLIAWRFRSNLTPAVAFAAPVAVCGILLAAYNYIRYGSLLEFGVRYILLANRNDMDLHFGAHLDQAPQSLYVLLLSPAGREPGDSSVGLLWSSPIALLGLLAPALLFSAGIKSRLQLNSTRFMIRCVWISCFCILLLMIWWRFNLGRYVVDFGPGFVWVAWCVAAVRWQIVRELATRRRLSFQVAIAIAALYGAMTDIWICGVQGPR